MLRGLIAALVPETPPPVSFKSIEWKSYYMCVSLLSDEWVRPSSGFAWIAGIARLETA